MSRLGFAADAADFMRIADSLGIQISERTAHRILGGAVKPVRSVSSRLMRKRVPAHAPAAVDLTRDRRGLKIAADDLDAFSRAVERDFTDLAERYYLTLSSDPKVRVTRDAITVTIPIQNVE